MPLTEYKVKRRDNADQLEGPKTGEGEQSQLPFGALFLIMWGWDLCVHMHECTEVSGVTAYVVQSHTKENDSQDFCMFAFWVLVF